MVAMWRSTEAARPSHPVKKVIRTERCRDSEGNLHKVVVWRDWPSLPMTSYTLEDGTAVHYEDDCFFTIVPTGATLTRCED